MVRYFDDGSYRSYLLFLHDPSATKETKRNPEIYGKIKEIGDTYMLIEVADGVRIRVDKTSIFASAEDAQQQK